MQCILIAPPPGPRFSNRGRALDRQPYGHGPHIQLNLNLGHMSKRSFQTASHYKKWTRLLGLKSLKQTFISEIGYGGL